MKQTHSKPQNMRHPNDVPQDIIATGWIMVVATAYYGPLLYPQLLNEEGIFTKIYAAMVIVSTLSITINYLRRRRSLVGKTDNNR
jgi:hypothetical protein